MHGDFSRDSYDPTKNFTGVLMQQGRLIVDADWNEQHAIVLNYLRDLGADIIGWHGGPDVTNSGGATPIPTDGPFLVKVNSANDVVYSGGRYYVDGILVNATPAKPSDENNWPPVVPIEQGTLGTSPAELFVFLDVWERFVPGYFPDDLLDPAFQGTDSCGRTKTVFAVRIVGPDQAISTPIKDQNALRSLKYEINIDGTSVKRSIDAPRSKASGEAALPVLAAWTKSESPDRDSCNADENGGFLGPENQLYRIEVHSGGKDGKIFWDGKPESSNSADAFTIKWSRNNGSVAFAAHLTGKTATMKGKWRDAGRAIRKQDWVEILADNGDVGELAQVADVRIENGQVLIEFQASPTSKPGVVLLRRWDHRGRKNFPLIQGAILVKQDSNATGTEPASVPIPLEDNLVVQLKLPADAEFRAGDYWQIPARTATGGIIWPSENSDPPAPKFIPARFVEHHYAPLALVTPGNPPGMKMDLRRRIVQAKTP
jgi:hypothetical protein